MRIPELKITDDGYEAIGGEMDGVKFKSCPCGVVMDEMISRAPGSIAVIQRLDKREFYLYHMDCIATVPMEDGTYVDGPPGDE